MIHGILTKIAAMIPFNKKNLTQEFATRRRSPDFSAFLYYLPDPDPILRKQGKDISVYRELLSDAHIWACVQSRKAGVTSLEWSIDRGKAKSQQAKIIENVFNRMDLHKIISEILDASVFGFQPMEIMWEYRDGYILPADVEAKPSEWFLFDPDNNLKFRTKENPMGEPLPEKKFLCPKYFASYQNPYGERTLSRCFWPASFKKGGMKFWATLAEKYGTPFLTGKLPRGTAQEEIDAMAESLDNMIQDAIAVIPDDGSVEILQAGGSGANADIHEKLIDKMNAECSKAILGQTLTTEVGSTGSYAASQTHFQVRADLVDSDKIMVERTLNQLIALIFEINWQDKQEMPVFSMWEEEDVDKDLADRDKTLTDCGVKFSKKYYMKSYGFEDEDFDIAETAATPPASGQVSFAAANNVPAAIDELDKLMSSFDDAAAQSEIEKVLNPVLDLIQNAKNPEEAVNLMAEAYPNMDTQKIEDMLTKLIFTSEIFGQLKQRNEL